MGSQDPIESAPLHWMEFPTNERQLDMVPMYNEQEVVEVTHPFPVVTHPDRKASHS